jgi:hypothetical protein
MGMDTYHLNVGERNDNSETRYSEPEKNAELLGKKYSSNLVRTRLFGESRNGDEDEDGDGDGDGWRSDVI